MKGELGQQVNEVLWREGMKKVGKIRDLDQKVVSLDQAIFLNMAQSKRSKSQMLKFYLVSHKRIRIKL